MIFPNQSIYPCGIAHSLTRNRTPKFAKKNEVFPQTLFVNFCNNTSKNIKVLKKIAVIHAKKAVIENRKEISPMGNGFDINNIKHLGLRDLAYWCDTNSNGRIDEDEVSIFITRARFVAFSDDNDLAQEELQDIKRKVDTNATSIQNTVIEEQHRDLDKKEKKLSRKNFEQEIEAILSNKDIKTLSEAKTALQDIVKRSNNTVYSENFDKMQAYFEKAEASQFNSKEDIDALKKELKKIEGYDKDLAESVLAFCEKVQIQKEVDEVSKMFFEIQSENYTTKLEELKTKLKEEGKWNKSYYETAFDFVKDNVVPQTISSEIRETLVSVSGDARSKNLKEGEKLPETKDELVEEIKKAHKKNITNLNFFLTELKRLPDLKNVTETQYEGLSDSTKKMLGDIKKYKQEGATTYDLSRFDVEEDTLQDKVFDQAIKDNEVFIEVARRRGIVLNRRKELQHFTQEQYDALSPKLKVLLDKNDYLKNHKRSDKDGNTYYDLSDLSEIIEYRSGADFIVNIDKDSPQDSELEYIRTDLNKKFKIEYDISDELKEIIELCDYETYDKDHDVTISKLGKGLLNGAASGAVAGAVTTSKRNIVVNYDPHDYNIHINNVLSQNIGDLEGLDIDTIINIVTDPTQIKIKYAESLLKNISTGAIAGAAVGMVMSALHTWLIGNDVGAETSCVSLLDYDNTNRRYTNYNEFVDYVKSKGDYDKLKGALEKFKPGDKVDPNAANNWDHAMFFNILRQDAGVGSRLNPQECVGRIYKDVEVPPPPKEVEKEEIEKNKEEKKKTPVDEPLYYDEKTTEHVNMNVQKQSWQNLSREKLYDCFGDSDRENIRMMKIMQGMSGELLYIEDLEALRDITFKTKGLFRKNADGTYDITYTEKKLREAFKDFQFPAGYNYNYHQAAVALCSTTMGDENNNIIAPMTLYRRNGDSCNRKENIKPAPRCNNRKDTKNRGQVSETKTIQRATQRGDNGEINMNPTPQEFDNYKQKGKKKAIIT